MLELITISGVNFISASSAGKFFNYTPDYITKLAREGRVKGTRLGKFWYVCPDSLQKFVESAEAQKKIRGSKLREERRKEQQETKVTQSLETRGGSERLLTDSKRHSLVALQQTLTILFLGLTLGATGYFIRSVELQLPVGQEASVVGSSILSLERLALFIYHFTSSSGNGSYVESPSSAPSASVSLGSTTPGQVTTTTTTTYTSLLVAPDTVFTATDTKVIKDSFSDEVEVSVDPKHPDTGTIVPVFKDRKGEAYRFLMMPLNTPSP